MDFKCPKKYFRARLCTRLASKAKILWKHNRFWRDTVRYTPKTKIKFRSYPYTKNVTFSRRFYFFIIVDSVCVSITRQVQKIHHFHCIVYVFRFRLKPVMNISRYPNKHVGQMKSMFFQNEENLKPFGNFFFSQTPETMTWINHSGVKPRSSNIVATIRF